MLRLATSDDLEAICALFEVMHAENGVGSLDQAKARGAISEVIEEGTAVLVTENGKPVATLGLTMESWWYSNDRFMVDKWFFVHPDHRTSGYASKLIGFLKSVSNSQKIPVVLGVSTRRDTLSKLKFFKKYMQPFGGAFIHLPEAA